MNKRLQPFFDSARVVPYLLGTAVTTLIIQLGIDWSNQPGLWQGSYTFTLIVIALTLAAFAVISYQNRPGHLYLLPERKPRPRRGLILLISKHKAAAPTIIQYHCGTLTHCWLIATSQSAEIAAELAADFADEGIEFYFGAPHYQVNDDDAASTHRLVKHILTVDAPAQGLSKVDLIADITGGSKPMTAGLFLACVSEQTPVEYVLAKKDAAGIIRPGEWGEPIKISTSFAPATIREG